MVHSKYFRSYGTKHVWNGHKVVIKCGKMSLLRTHQETPALVSNTQPKSSSVCEEKALTTRLFYLL